LLHRCYLDVLGLSFSTDSRILFSSEYFHYKIFTSRGPAVAKHCSRIPRKDRIRNVAIGQQIGLEEKIIKVIEQKQLTWHGHVQRMAEGRLLKRALKWMPKKREHE
jgi:hypothetical protein